MTKLKVTHKVGDVAILPIDEAATTDPQNLNKHTQRGGGLLENSLRRRGANRSVASAGKGVDTPVLTAGNFTYEKAVSAGFEKVMNVYTDGQTLVNVVRLDIAPGTVEAVALGLEDNEISKQSYAVDLDLLAQMAVGDNALLAALRKEDDIFNGLLEGMGDNQSVKTLEELAAEYGESEEDDFYPIIKIKVTQEIKERFDAIMVLMPGSNEMEKIDALISCGELA